MLNLHILNSPKRFLFFISPLKFKNQIILFLAYYIFLNSLFYYNFIAVPDLYNFTIGTNINI